MQLVILVTSTEGIRNSRPLLTIHYISKHISQAIFFYIILIGSYVAEFHINAQ